MNVKPIGERVLIKPTPVDSKTKGGIIIPDTAKEAPLRGQVVAVGSSKEGIMTLQVDDWVYYGKYAGQEIEVDGEKYVIMHEQEVLLVVDVE